MPPMILAQAADPSSQAIDLLGSWWPVISMVATPILTSFMTKEQAQKYLKQLVAVFFTAVFVVLSVIQDGISELNPETIITRLAIYSSAAEVFYRTASGVTGGSMNSFSVFRPNTGLGSAPYPDAP